MTNRHDITTVVEGRPKLPIQYSDEIAEEILQRLMDGETLTSICRDIGIRPHQVYTWTEHREEFARRFARARDFGDLMLEDQAIDFSDLRNADEETDETVSQRGSSASKKKFDNVARSRLQAEMRLKVVARRKGAKITNEIKIANKSESEEAAELSTDALLEIARMNTNEGEAE